jgi:lysine biosynthesis protein LysW
MIQSGKKRTGKCPSCGENIYLGDRARIGQVLNCCSCEDELEVIRLNPIILDWAYIPGDDGNYFDEELEFGGRIRW